MKKYIRASSGGNIPYQLVSMAAIIRDFDDPEYLNDEHYKLTSIADYLYNSADGAFSSHPEDNLLPEFKAVFDQYGADYFKKVTDDMYAIDGQVTSAAKANELLADYMDRLHGGITASTKVTAATNYDTKLISKWLKAKFDDEAFGTAYTTHRISDADAYMGRNGLTYNRKNNTIDLWKSGGDEDIPVFKVIPQYSSTKRQGTYAPKLPKLVPIDEWNATHNVEGSTGVTATGNPFYDKLSEKDKRFVKNIEKDLDVISIKGKVGNYTTTLTIDMWYGDKFEPMKYGADASVYGNGEYRGNIYDNSGKIIGDYTADDSTLISKNFQIDWGD